MTESQVQAGDDALYNVLKMLIQSGHEREIREFRWAERPMIWVKDDPHDL
jgi:hypothetical protein